MKKSFLFVILVFLLSFSSTYAQSAWNKIQDCQLSHNGPCYLYDLKVGKEYAIDKLGIINVIEAEQWDEYWNSIGYRSANYDDVLQADTVVLKVGITNTTFKSKNYLDQVSVKMVYNNQFEIKGWWHQLKDEYEYVYDTWVYEQKQVFKYVSESNCFQIDPFYQGYYRFGVTVPDYIVKDSKPLYLEITIGDVSMTYIIRK